jgi:exodeoxyribonuclease VII large subunit
VTTRPSPHSASGAAAPSGPSTPENPWPVRVVATKISQWIDRLGAVWVEGQLTQVNIRGGLAYLVLRDPAVEFSLQATCGQELVRNAPVPLTEGSQVVVLGKPYFYAKRGSLTLRVLEIRAVGIGELLARIERVKALMAAEGLFDPRLKRPLPYLPNRVGLITARDSAAQRDVMTVAQRRWPQVRFEVRNTLVQGPHAAGQVIEALRELDADPQVDVIIIARGGGSVEDLLPFSDEALCRAIAAATTPIVSAIGHEPDNPLSDYVADLRAATPTDAAKRVVPDVEAELALVRELRGRSAAALRGWVQRESRQLELMRGRPVLADPLSALDRRAEEIERARTAARRDVQRLIESARAEIGYLRARLATLGPAATLARGYAVVQRIPEDGAPVVLRSVEQAPEGTRLRVRVADGVVHAHVDTPPEAAVNTPPEAAVNTAPADPASADSAPRATKRTAGRKQ